jgi:hypothetical protein
LRRPSAPGRSWGRRVVGRGRGDDGGIGEVRVENLALPAVPRLEDGFGQQASVLVVGRDALGDLLVLGVAV